MLMKNKKLLYCDTELRGLLKLLGLPSREMCTTAWNCLFGNDETCSVLACDAPNSLQGLILQSAGFRHVT